MTLEDSLLDSIYYEAAGGVLVHDDRVLILFRPKRGEVRLPKGHIDPGESAETAALREVQEECGYGPLAIRADLGRQDVTFILEERQVVRHERYFLMAVTTAEPELVHPPEAQFEPQWHLWDTAEAYLTFEAEKEWVRRARAALATFKERTAQENGGRSGEGQLGEDKTVERQPVEGDEGHGQTEWE